MSKKQETQRNELSIKAATELQKAYANELETKPEFSLDADPTGELHLSDLQKRFICAYVNYRDICKVADALMIPVEDAKDMLTQYNIQNEIRRINRAIYHRQFKKQLVSVDEIGGYLSSLLTDDCVPEADRLRSIEKLRVVDLLLRLNDLKTRGMQDPAEVMSKDLDVQIRKLSLTTITMLLNQSKDMTEKNRIIDRVDNGSLTPEEKAYLSTLPTGDLLMLIEDTNGGKDNGNQ